MSMALIENGGQIASVDRQNDRFQPNTTKTSQKIGTTRRWRFEEMVIWGYLLTDGPTMLPTCCDRLLMKEKCAHTGSVTLVA